MKLKKDITFIYMDDAEKSFMDLLSLEASKRGYKTEVTRNKFKKCEIGVYCQHINFPENSKFSMIMLHDILQQHSFWPNIWYLEPWDKYDVGILPSKKWEDNWNKCSMYKYANPRKGIYLIGWPKADKVANLNIEEYRKSFYKEYNLDLNKKTVLYAPSWENDNKQDDFVQAMLGLNVNILIKQASADPKLFPVHVENVERMAKLHSNIKGVTILPSSMNIYNAIAASDLIVSDESSTMAEACMLNIPAIAVSDWLIPDVTPSRYPYCDYDFVYKTTKANLKDFTSNLLDNYSEYKEKTVKYSNENFMNIGKSCEMIMDIIDDYVDNKEVRYPSLKPQESKSIPLKNNIKRIGIQIHRRAYSNWKEKDPIFKASWKLLKGIKDKIKG